MTNAEKFVEVFGTDLKRQYATKSWWEQEFEQPESCGDCISRQAVLMEIDKYLCGVPFEEKGIDKVIKELPSVTPKQSFEGKTNGEVLEAVFPKAKVDRYIDEYERPSDYLMRIDDETYFTKEWWNAPYKGGAE